MDRALQQLVRERAGDRCEYCLLPQRSTILPHQLDHVIAQKHHGTTDAANLCLSCYYCNSFKGPNVAGVDAESGQVTRLYHPRQDEWAAHFSWQGPILLGRTPIGRVTIDVLNI